MNMQSNVYRLIYDSSVRRLTSVSGAGSSPALATCETSQVLLAGVPGVFFFFFFFVGGSPVFAHLLIGPSHMS